MALVAEAVGRLFARFEPLQAYRIDILGSVAGIAAFSVLSLVGAQPWVWGVAIAVLLLTSAGWPSDRLYWIGAAAVVGVFALASISPTDTWSPYYRVTVSAAQADGSRAIKVNGLPHQAMTPIDRLVDDQPFYFDVYEHLDREPGRTLVIGAGNGNDVAIALSEGATHVDAVEIDPVIRAAGADLHPDHPYDDPRVTAVTDDGRAFLRADRCALRPDPVRAAGFPDARRGTGIAPAGELPVHRGVHADGARPPRRRRRPVDVQLLPPVRVPAVRRDPADGLRTCSVLGSGPGFDRPAEPGRADDRRGSGGHLVSHTVADDGGCARAGDR